MTQSQAFEAAAEAIAGSIGGFISSAVLFPLDYVKTQQQAGTVKGSFLTVAAKVYRERGLLAFYSGAFWRGFQSGYEKIIYFYLFAFARNAYVKRFGALDPIMNLVIGYVSNWCQLPFTMPVDTCVNGMITTGKSFGTMVKTVIDNPAGAYKGMAAYSIAALKPAVQFTVVEQMRFRLIAANAGTQYEGGLSSSQVRKLLVCQHSYTVCKQFRIVWHAPCAHHLVCSGIHDGSGVEDSFRHAAVPGPSSKDHAADPCLASQHGSNDAERGGET